MTDQPDIVVLLLDAARADRLSPYGCRRDTTPFLDELAEESTVFERAYSTSIWSLPAYGSFFTGLLPSEHGAVSWGDEIERNSLLEELSERGYRTCAVSPHVLPDGYNIATSFDELIEVTEGNLDARLDGDPVAKYVQDRNQAGGWDSKAAMIRDVLGVTIEERSWETVPNGLRYLVETVKRRRGHWGDDGAATILEEARELLSRDDEPVFLFANFIEPHEDYRPPREYARRFVDDDVSFREMDEAVTTSTVATNLGLTERTERQRRILADLYDAELAYLDDQFRSFYEWLDARDSLDESVLLVFSDHGDLFGEWNVWGHSSRIHNSLCRVPLIIRYPWERPRREPGLTSLQTLHDHLVDIGSSERPGSEALVSDRVFVEYHGLETQYLSRPWTEHGIPVDRVNCYQASVVEGDHRLLWDSQGTVELYEPRTDPDETHDLADERPGVVEELRSAVADRLGTPQERQDAYDGRVDRTVTDREVRRRLEDLGYV